MLLSGCAVSDSWVATPAADPNAPYVSSAMPRSLALDSTTRRTNELLAAVGANNLEGLKPMDHGAMSGDMKGMDHSKMQNRPPGTQMPGTDHSKMEHKMNEQSATDHQSMGHSQEAAPAEQSPSPTPSGDAQNLAEEMQKLAEEMKKTSDAIKQEADENKKSVTPPMDDHQQHTAPASQQ